MRNNVLHTLFRWQPGRDTVVAFAAGVIVLLLSAALIPTRETTWLNIFIHDELMIAAVGLLFPLWYIRRTGNDFAGFGLTWRRWAIYLPI